MSSYEFEFTYKEFFRLLFYKKICPLCTRKLDKKKDKIKTGWYSEDGTYHEGDHNQLKFYYYCPNCLKDIELLDLKHRRIF
ncbi:MAG: hypothetical protein K0R47_4981 [Brevibacillus sp.]|jgi:hypothetical protein|nr:hypothetical protein [Brevibacillus sp.]